MKQRIEELLKMYKSLNRVIRSYEENVKLDGKIEVLEELLSNAEGEVTNQQAPSATPLDNKTLVLKVREWVTSLCNTGGRAWSLSVPVNFERDPDMLIEELCKRFEHECKSQAPSATMKTVAEEIACIMDEYDVSCPIERKDVAEKINAMFQFKTPSATVDEYIDYKGYRYWYQYRSPKDRVDICLATKDPNKYCNGFFLYSTKDAGTGMEFVVTDTNNPNDKWWDNSQQATVDVDAKILEIAENCSLGKDYTLKTISALSQNRYTGEDMRKYAIDFLDSIRDYERENGQRICFDERESSELLDQFDSEGNNEV